MTPTLSLSEQALQASAIALVPPIKPRGSNHVGMRQFNERVVLQTLRSHGPTPKAELARLTGLTAQTIGLITSRLDEDGLLCKGEPLRGKIGQPSVPLYLNPDGAFSVGIKVGRRNADWLLVDFCGQVRERRQLVYDFPDVARLLPSLHLNLNGLLDSLGDLRDRMVGVGVATPFQLGGWHRLLGLSDAQADAWNQIDLSAEVQAMTDLPVSFARDTVAATVAELVQGRGQALPNFLYLFVDTFVGGGLVLNSHIHKGVHGNAGAVASVPLHAASQTAVPAQLLEKASVWTLERRFQANGLEVMAAYDERALLPPWLPHTQTWLDESAMALAQLVVSATALLDMDAVVMDGSIAQPLLQRLLQRTETALTRYDWQGLFDPPQMLQGSMGPDARALGGALLPLHACFAPDRDVFLKV